jgi:O-antigen ligase
MAAIQTPAVAATARAPQSLLWGLFVGCHAILGLAFVQLPMLATLHAVACVGVGVIVAARRRPIETSYVVAYIVGSEVLWRMTHAGVFWEYGKYATAAVLFIALTRVRIRRNRWLAIGYLALLLPSAILTFLGADFAVARQLVSFNLSGPLSLMMCVLFYSNVRLEPEDIRRTFGVAIAPIFAIATVAYFSTVTAVNLEFNSESNTVTSGGFGPNQVSAMLGLSLLFTLLLLIERRPPWRKALPLVIFAIMIATQAALTFSRGGLALAFAAVIAAVLYLVRERRTRVTILILGVLLFSVGKYVVVPKLDAFTSGRFSERYATSTSSNRVKLANFDLEIFAANPVMGVGPGMARDMRGDLGLWGAAHTEFTRMLSEHGILGVLAILLLFVMGLRAVLAARTLMSRALVVALFVWFTLFLLVNAMRVSAPSFVFGLACCIAYSSIPLRSPQRDPQRT